MSQLTIAGKTFDFTPKYAEGHTLNANEASALNQTLAENLRNNFATKIKKAEEDGSAAPTQDDFNAYAESYQFGVRTGGGGGSRGNPVETEAMNMAREIVKQKISTAGKKISDYSAKQISEAAAKVLEKDPSIREQAAERVKAMQATASAAVDDDILAGLGEPEGSKEEPTSEGETSETAAGSRKRRASGE